MLGGCHDWGGMSTSVIHLGLPPAGVLGLAAAGQSGQQGAVLALGGWAALDLPLMVLARDFVEDPVVVGAVEQVVAAESSTCMATQAATAHVGCLVAYLGHGLPLMAGLLGMASSCCGGWFERGHPSLRAVW